MFWRLLRGRLRWYLRKNVPVAYAVSVLTVCAGIPLVLCELGFVHAGMVATSRGGTLNHDQFIELVTRLDKQKEQRSSWAYAALVAIVAVTVVKRLFHIPWLRFAYVLLTVAATLLFETIRAGDEYEQRIAGLIVAATLRPTKCVTEVDFDTVVNLLWLQMKFLRWAAAMLLLFVSTFLAAALSGRLEYDAHDRP
jgi:hypothetical protein